MTRPDRPHPREWPPVLVAFVLVAAVLALTDGVALYESREFQTRIDSIVSDAMVSTRLAERMGGDIYRERLLVDAHILESKPAAMARVESQIAEVEADYAATDRAYGSHADFPGERSAWKQLDGDVAWIRAPLAHATALSRDNLDAQAREALRAAGVRFSAIESDVARLVEINQRAADEALSEMERLQRRSLGIFAGLALIGVALTVFIGLRTTRLARQREDQISRYASLLELQNRDLDAFAGRVAHDLRGPLTTIKTTASVLASQAPEPSGPVARLGRAAAQMESVIDDLLALSRLGADAAGAACDPAQVVARLQEDLGTRLEAEGAALRLAVAPAQVRCTEGLLRQALTNLADNAVKYRRAGVASEVAIEGQAGDGKYRLRVRDNGVGMSEEEARRAFDPFYRAERVQEAPGTGLGLSIVKRVVEASGGTVSVESELGQGTTFVVELPLVGVEGQDRSG
jgi:two-component system, OmpR family, sensor kinase